VVQGCTTVGGSQRESAKHKQVRNLRQCFVGDLKEIILIYFEARLTVRKIMPTKWSIRGPLKMNPNIAEMLMSVNEPSQ